MENNVAHTYKTDNSNIESILLSDDLNKALNIRLKTPITIKIEIKLDPNKLYDINLLEKLSKIDNNITIIYGYEDVNIEKFIYVMKSLNNMANPANLYNFSPLEKYLYIYNLTTHFKPYKEEDYKEDEMLSLFKIFDEDNDLIVCGGFAKILFELCKRVNIRNQLIRVNTSEMTYEAYKKSSPHIRNISRLIDNNYNIDGIYINDSTWNNNLTKELYTTALLTPYESISVYDTNINTGNHDLLSAQSYDEFIYQLEKDSKNNFVVFKQTLDYIIYLCPEILSTLNSIPSYNKFNSITNKTIDDYNELLNDEKFIYYIFDYIYEKCNKRISGKVIISALTNIIKTIYKDISEEEIKKYIETVTKNNIDNYDNLFLIAKEYDNGYYTEYLTQERTNKFKC